MHVADSTDLPGTPAITQRMASLLSGVAHGEGFSPSRLPGVKFMRSTRHVPRLPVKYEPSIVMIAQGVKHGYLGDRRFLYDPSHYLVLSVPLPFECETFGTPHCPLLGLSIGVSPALVTELLLHMPPPPSIHPPSPQAIQVTALDQTLAAAAVRLLECLRSDEESRILGPGIVREIIYRVLCGAQSAHLHALAAPHSHFSQISRVLHRFHHAYAASYDVGTLARDAGMSLSTFHHHFKAITSSTPLQYLKAIRLHKARLLMVSDGCSAAQAADAVGYESASQFSREFKRYFGLSPAAAAAQLRENRISLA